MPADKRFFKPVLIAGCIFTALLAVLLALPRADSRAHQAVMEAVSILVFASAILSLRYPSLPHPQPLPFSFWGGVPALLLAVVTYAPAMRVGFLSDDFTYVLWARGPLLPILEEQFTRGLYSSFFRPLGSASLAIDYRIWHAWPVGWHVTNLAIHLMATAAVFYLGKELDCDAEACGAAALVFAVLPVNTEAIVWVATRFDLLATLLMLGTLIFYLQARRTGSTVRYTTAVVCFVLALLSKESAYIIPLALCATELFLMERRSWRAPLPFFLIAGGAMLYRVHVLGSLGGYRAAGNAPGSLSFGTASLMGLLVRAPSELLFGINWQQPRIALSCVLAAAAAALLLPLSLLRPRGASRRLFTFALVWCFFAALPAQSLLMIPPTLTNTRELYFSSVGAAFLIALLLARIGDSAWRHAWTAALTLCLVATTWHNIAAWRHASRITADFLTEMKAEVPDPPAGAAFVFHSMPRWAEGGVYLLLHRALGDSVCLTYGRDDIRARREDEPGLSDQRAVIDMDWIGDWQGMRRPLIARRNSPRE